MSRLQAEQAGVRHPISNPIGKRKTCRNMVMVQLRGILNAVQPNAWRRPTAGLAAFSRTRTGTLAGRACQAAHCSLFCKAGASLGQHSSGAAH